MSETGFNSKLFNFHRLNLTPLRIYLFSFLLAAGTGILLIAVMIIAPGVNGMVGMSSSVLGSLILGPETRGYIIVALLSFTLGVLATIITQKYRRIDKELHDKDKSADK